MGRLAGTWRGAGCRKGGDLVISRNGLFRTGVDSLVRFAYSFINVAISCFSSFVFPPQLLSSSSAHPPSLHYFRSVVGVPPLVGPRKTPNSICHLEYDSLAAQLNFNQFTIILGDECWGGAFIQDRNCLQVSQTNFSLTLSWTLALVSEKAPIIQPGRSLFFTFQILHMKNELS